MAKYTLADAARAAAARSESSPVSTAQTTRDGAYGDGEKTSYGDGEKTHV